MTAEGERTRRRRRLVDTRAGQVHVREAGEPGQPVLVLLHQTATSSRMWLPVLGALGQRLHVVAPDLPGCGCSDPFPARPALDDYVTVVLDVLDAVGMERVAVGGFHAGAGIAVAMAATRPERVERLVLLGVPLFGEERRRAILARLGATPAIVPDEQGGHLAALWGMSTNPDLGVRQRETTDRLVAGPDSWWLPAALFAEDLRPLLRAVTAPALLLHARGDFVADAQPEAAELLGGARRVELDGQMLVADEHPDEVAAAILDFTHR